MAPFENELTLEELEAEIVESLPERAAMSTFNVTGMGAATGTLNAASDAAAAPLAAQAEPVATSTEAPRLFTKAGSLKPALSAIMIAGFQPSSFIVLV